jgi:methionyl-tRNA synthetase
MDQQPSPSQPPPSAPSTADAGSATPADVPAGEPIAAGQDAAVESAAPPAETASEASLVSIDQFGVIDLRVAVVQGYERVAGTDRLLKLDIDLGTERRTIVSGIAHLIDPETLVGRRIVVVANLQPARIRGVESRGMLLAAGGRGPGEPFALVTVPETIAPGARVS